MYVCHGHHHHHQQSMSCVFHAGMAFTAGPSLTPTTLQIGLGAFRVSSAPQVWSALAWFLLLDAIPNTNHFTKWVGCLLYNTRQVCFGMVFFSFTAGCPSKFQPLQSVDWMPSTWHQLEQSHFGTCKTKIH